MKSILGLVLALIVVAVFAVAYALAIRPNAGWLDAQWLFLAAIPYNWTLLRVVGESQFSSDAPGQVAAAMLFEAALAYLAGAILEKLARGAWRLTRFRSRA